MGFGSKPIKSGLSKASASGAANPENSFRTGILDNDMSAMTKSANMQMVNLRTFFSNKPENIIRISNRLEEIITITNLQMC